MQNKYNGSILKLFIIILMFCTIFYSCANNKPPFKIDYEIGEGTVVGKEQCFQDTSKNHWLINIPGPNPFNKVYGDTVILNRITYSNIVKSSFLLNKDLSVGMKYTFDFNLLGKGVTSGCNVPAPSVYPISLIEIIRSRRIAN